MSEKNPDLDPEDDGIVDEPIDSIFSASDETEEELTPVEMDSDEEIIEVVYEEPLDVRNEVEEFEEEAADVEPGEFLAEEEPGPVSLGDFAEEIEAFDDDPEPEVLSESYDDDYEEDVDDLGPILNEAIEEFEDDDDDGPRTPFTGIEIPLAPDPRVKSDLRRKRLRRLWKFTKFCLFMLVLLLIVSVVAGVGAYFYCMPRYELAQSMKMERIDDLEVASKIYDRKGRELGRIYVQNRQPIPFENVSQNFVHALLAAEDSRFYEHNGVDPKGILRAIFQAVKSGEVSQGASTITQQLARNAFDLREKSISRKVTEAFLARRIEEEIGDKNKIMELYMNRVYFGDGYYGIAAASDGFFGKKAADLTIAEAATLAGVVRNPYYRGPRKFPEASKATRDGVIARMEKLGFIDEGQKKAGQDSPLKTVAKRTQTGRFKYVYERVRQQVIELIGYETVSQGGYTIRTTIDMDVQQAAEEKLKAQLEEVESRQNYAHQTLDDYKKMKVEFEKTAGEGSQPPAPVYLQGSLLMIENKTGAIISLVGGRDFSDSMFDRTYSGRRPLGTAFLPFVYAAAFESGRFPGSLVDDAPMDNRFVQIGGLTGIVAEWGPEQLESTYENSITYRRALSKSAIAAAVRVGMKAERQNVIGLAKSAGLTFDGDLQRFNATFLGRNTVSMTEVVKAYSIFPNNGNRPESTYLIENITDSTGVNIFTPEKGLTNRPTIDQYTAFQISSCLQDSLKSGSGKKASTEYGLGDYPVAGKTGTEYGFTDNWFVGYTSEVTCAVWAGFDQTQEIYPLAFSADTVLPVWTEVMNKATEHYPPQPFTIPTEAAQVEVCTHSGELATNDCIEILENGTQIRTTFMEYLRPGTEVKSICSIHGRPGSQVLSGAQSLTMGNQNKKKPIRVSLAGAQDAEPVIPVAMTVVGLDPYNSVAPKLRAKIVIPKKRTDEDGGDDNSDDENAESGPLRAIPLNSGPVAKPVEVGANGLPVVRPVLEEDPVKPFEGRVRLDPPAPIVIE